MLLDTEHFFHTSLTQCLVFLVILYGQESKIWTFFEGLRSSWGPQKQERKNNHNSTIFWAKNKIRMKFLWNKLLEFLLLNEVLKDLIFFHLPIKKIGFITLIMSKFQILKTYLCNLYKKSWVYCLHFHFLIWKIKFLELLRPSKTSVQGQKR